MLCHTKLSTYWGTLVVVSVLCPVKNRGFSKDDMQTLTYVPYKITSITRGKLCSCKTKPKKTMVHSTWSVGLEIQTQVYDHLGPGPPGGVRVSPAPDSNLFSTDVSKSGLRVCPAPSPPRHLSFRPGPIAPRACRTSS